MFVLGFDQHYFALDVLDYQEKDSAVRQEKNQLLVSIHIKQGDYDSVVTAPLISTYELSALGNWFGQVASGTPSAPIVLLEPGLIVRAISSSGQDQFQINVGMTALASPTWSDNQFYHPPFKMEFLLTYQQMLQVACQLQDLHLRFPTQ